MLTPPDVVFHFEEKIAYSKIFTICDSLLAHLITYLPLRDRTALHLNTVLRTRLYSQRLDLFASPSIALTKLMPLLQTGAHIVGLNIKSHTFQPGLPRPLPTLTKLHLTQVGNTHFDVPDNSGVPPNLFETKQWNIACLSYTPNLTQLILNTPVVDYAPLQLCQSLVRLEIRHFDDDSFALTLPRLRYLTLVAEKPYFHLDLGHFPSMEEISLSSSELINVPDFMGCPNLKTLITRRASQVMFPHTFAPMVKLEKVVVENFSYLTNVNVFETQTALKEFHLNYICEDGGFEWLAHCCDLEQVTLMVGSTQTKNVDLALLAKCSKLTVLNLGDGEWDYSVLSHFPALREITFPSFNMEALTFSPPREGYPGLQKVGTTGYSSKITSFAFLRTCPNLQALELYPIFVADISSLTSCSQLETLIIHSCPHVTNWNFLAHCPNLRYVDIDENIFRDGNPFGANAKITHLDTSFLPGMIDLAPFSQLEDAILLIDDVAEPREGVLPIRVRGGPNLRTLKIDVAHDPHHIILDNLLPRIEKIHIVCSQLEGLNNCPSLKELEISYITTTALPHLETCSALETLALVRCDHLTTLPPLAGCPNLTRIDILNCSGLTNLHFLAGCQRLTMANLHLCINLTDISALSTCLALTKLNLAETQVLTDLAPLRHCSRLRMLDLSYSNVADLYPLGACSELEQLNLAGLSELFRLACLSSCHKLRVLDIRGCSSISDMETYVRTGWAAETIWFSSTTGVPGRDPTAIRDIIRLTTNGVST